MPKPEKKLSEVLAGKSLDKILNTINDENAMKDVNFTYPELVDYVSKNLSYDDTITLLKKFFQKEFNMPFRRGELYGIAAKNIYPKKLELEFSDDICVGGMGDEMEKGDIVINTDINHIGDILGGKITVNGNLKNLHRVRGGKIIVNGEIELFQSAYNTKVTTKKIKYLHQQECNPLFGMENTTIKSDVVDEMCGFGGIIICDKVNEITNRRGTNDSYLAGRVYVVDIKESLLDQNILKQVIEKSKNLNRSRDRNLLLSKEVGKIKYDYDSTLITKKLGKISCKYRESDIKTLRIDDPKKEGLLARIISALKGN